MQSFEMEGLPKAPATEPKELTRTIEVFGITQTDTMERRYAEDGTLWDNVLMFFDRPLVQRTNIVLATFLAAGVLLISCLTLGWHGLCQTEEDCHARDVAYIVAVHVVNSIADVLIAISLPWRIMQTRHALKGSIGYDWHGRKSNFLFFHIPHTRRKCIMMLLLWNALFHYSNHILRIVCYRTYNAHIRMPGLLVTNIFVGLSATCLFSAHGWIAWECWRLAKDDSVAKVVFFEEFCRMKKHYPLEDCSSDDETHRTPPESLASQSDDDFEDEEGSLAVDSEDDEEAGIEETVMESTRDQNDANV